MSERLNTQEDLARALSALGRRDARLTSLVEREAGTPVRRRTPGLEGLVHCIMGQQVSVASAAAIWGRLKAATHPFDAETLASHSDETLRSAGLSGAKVRTVRALAAAVLDGRLDLDALFRMPDDEARAALVALPGIGPWTAELYLLFCEGRGDIWPAGDLALQVALMDALELPERPNALSAQEIAADWRPHRGAAAHLFWAHYRRIKGRSGVPL
ncbi:DNA-3-methyladenine glycosylase family protein [Lutibaculum baratangense]|nr:DNA-3-methyladenine glycosylase [Lutibaculum baratangense]